MATLSAGSTLIWFLAEFEAIAAHYPEIVCFKLCDLDVAGGGAEQTGGDRR